MHADMMLTYNDCDGWAVKINLRSTITAYTIRNKLAEPG